MKSWISILALTTCIAMASCQNEGSNTENNSGDSSNSGGAQQVTPPVLNSGPETERDRALEAVEKDTTGKETHVGKDPNAENPTQKDTSR